MVSKSWYKKKSGIAHSGDHGLIDERNRMERDLKLMQLSVEKASDEIFWLGSNGRVIYVNEATCNILGYSREELMDMYVWDFDPTYSPEIWSDTFNDLKKKGFLTFETRHETRGGVVFPVEITANYVEYDGKGYSFAYVRDITGRKQAEEALRKSEEMLMSIIDSSPIPMVLYNEDEKSYYYNKKFTETFGYTVDDIPTIDEWWMLAYPEEKYRKFVMERWYASVDDAIKKRSSIVPQEVEVACKDGSKRYIMAEFSSIGKINLLVLYDITGRKRVEKDLRLTQFSVDRAADIALWVAPDARFIYANEAASRAFGYTREEFLSLKAFDINPSFNEKNWHEHWKEVKVHGSFTFESMLRKKDGTFFPGEITVNYIFYDGKEYNCSFIHDITERKRAEEELIDSKAQADLYLDLMGHDINNLNQIALGYLEMAADAVAGGEVKELVKKPIDAIRNSSKLIENVRKLQKLKDGGLKAESIDLSHMLAELKEQYMNVPGKEVTIDYAPCNDCRVMANGLLKDVFSNLIGNAIKHSGSSKSVWIGLRLERVMENGRMYCRVSVEDDGPGIPDVLKDKVFGRFRKEKAKAGGRGLGLYLVRSLVEDFHGTVRIEDRVKGDHTQGARFVVMLPAVEKP